jgi:hypothetical protein
MAGASNGLRSAAWQSEQQGELIHATFMDKRTATMRVGADGSLTPAFQPSVPAAITGAELDKRVSLATLLPNGRLQMAAVQGTDFREEEACTLVRQETCVEEHFEQPDSGGWTASISTRTCPSDGSDPRYPRGIDVTTRSCTISRETLALSLWSIHRDLIIVMVGHRLDPVISGDDMSKHIEAYPCAIAPPNCCTSTPLNLITRWQGNWWILHWDNARCREPELHPFRGATHFRRSAGVSQELCSYADR